MRRLLMIVGTLLIMIGIAALIVFVVLPPMISSLDAVPVIKGTFQALFCKSDELLIELRSSYRSPGMSRNTQEIDCLNETDQKRDISGVVIAAGLVGFLLPFFIGLLMVVGAAGLNPEKDKSPYAT